MKDTRKIKIAVWAEQTGWKAGTRCHNPALYNSDDDDINDDVEVYRGTAQELLDIAAAYRRNAARDSAHTHAYELRVARILKEVAEM